MKKSFKKFLLISFFIVLNCTFMFVLTGCWISSDENGLSYHLINKGREYEVYAGAKFNVDYTEVVIPDKHKGKPITRIMSNGFRNLYRLNGDGWSIGQTDKIKSIMLPSSIQTIGDSAFYGCDLEKITAESGKYKSDNNCIIEIATNTVVLGIKNSVIPDYVVCIGESAFLGCDRLEKIVIPSSVTCIGQGAFSETALWHNAPDNSVVYVDKWAVGYKGIPERTLLFESGTVGIGNNAFNGNESIESIVMPNTVEYVGDSAFYYSSLLKNIEMSLSTINIGENAFAGCKKLENVIIPSSIVKIGDNAFSFCSKLTNITIPSSVTSIGKGVFSHCLELENVIIPSSIVKIGDNAFSFCIKLTNITIPSSVTSIGKGVFGGCDGLESIKVADGNSVYKSDGDCIIEIATNKLIVGCKKSVIPNYVIEIGDYAFIQISCFTSIEIPLSVKSIGDHAFYNCPSLTTLVIPSSIESIGNYAFAHCNISNIIIPASVTKLGENAFHCSYITIYIEATSKPSGWSNNWNMSNRPVVWGYKE